MASSSSSPPMEFKSFDMVVSCPVDHSFYYTKSTKLNLGAQKKIAKEWTILEESLPRGTIYVRAYENRIELMRAVIVGAKGTPYHDVLFFFDIRFHSDYPSSPPELKYRSHGLRINPNLYSDGFVCLSLLNTFPGHVTQKWDPSMSTVLQVLVSIQGLVLNETPILNEPFTRFDICESTTYNERAFVLSCKSTLCLLRKRPHDFDEFVVSHYRERSSTILEACRAYSKGECRAGHYGSTSPTSWDGYVSFRFKDKIRSEIYKLLLDAFLKNSIEVSQDLVDFGLQLNNYQSQREKLGCVVIIIKWFTSFVNQL